MKNGPGWILGEENPCIFCEGTGKTRKYFPVWLKRKLCGSEISARTMTVFEREGLTHWHQIACKSERELMSYKGFGRKCLNEVKEILHEQGFSLGMFLKSYGDIFDH